MNVEVIRDYDKWKLATPPEAKQKQHKLSGIYLMIAKELEKRKREKNVK